MKYSPFLLYSGEETNANFAYFSNLGMKLYDHSFLFVDGPKKVLLVSTMNEKLARKNFKGKILTYGNLKSELKKLIGNKTIGIDGGHMTVKIYNILKRICKMKDVSKDFLNLRSDKKKYEVSKIKRAAKESREIIYSVNLKKCKTEKDVEKALIKETVERGLEIAFKPIVATDKNTSFPHYTPGKYKLKNNVLIDYGVKYQSYCGDITRYFSLKKGLWDKDYEMVKQLTNEIMDEVKNVENAGELTLFTNKLYEKYKLPKQLHSLGHGLGLELHESPTFWKDSKDILKNRVFTIEPGIYRSKWGARFEDDFYFNGKNTRMI